MDFSHEKYECVQVKGVAMDKDEVIKGAIEDLTASIIRWEDEHSQANAETMKKHAINLLEKLAPIYGEAE